MVNCSFPVVETPLTVVGVFFLSFFDLPGAGGAQTLSTAQLEKSAVGYFSSAVLVIIISLIGYILLLKLVRPGW